MRISAASVTKPIAPLALFVAFHVLPVDPARAQDQARKRHSAQAQPHHVRPARLQEPVPRRASPRVRKTWRTRSAREPLCSIFKKEGPELILRRQLPCPPAATRPRLRRELQNANAPNTGGSACSTCSSRNSPTVRHQPRREPLHKLPPRYGNLLRASPKHGHAPAGPLDPAIKLPDVLGIHLGAPRARTLRRCSWKLYPGNPVLPREGPDTVAGMGIININLPGGSGSDNVHLEFTLPPAKQKVYFIERSVLYKQQMSRDNVMASLHQKYMPADLRRYERGRAGEMIWLFDEQGHAIPPGPKLPWSPIRLRYRR